MNNNRVYPPSRIAQLSLLLLLLSTLNSQLSTLLAQGTAFTYQGQLSDGGLPASGQYDLRFTVYNAVSGGSPVGSTLDAADWGVSNGLFTVTLDFGASVFTGANRWLEIAVRPGASVGAFTNLTPRQKITATPYAVFAGGASAAGITGALPSASLFGNYNSTVSFNNGANSFNGSFYGQFFGSTFTGGSFIGDGSGLLNLNASQISEGAFPASSLENAWRIIGNTGTTDTNFIGTTDNQPLEFRVLNLRAFRIEPDQRPGNGAANIIGGHSSNHIEQAGTSGGSVIVGGGFDSGPNVIHSNASGVFIGGGSANQIGPNANDVVIAGGFANSAKTSDSTISGGGYNTIATNTDYAAIGGGFANFVDGGSGYSAIAGGAQNAIYGSSGFSAIGGGLNNKVHFQADQSAISGGNANEVFTGARESFIGGGFANVVHSNSYNGTISGGTGNIISNAAVATIGGGVGNTNTGYAGTVAGGFFNTAANNGAAVGGGGQNIALGFNSVVAGGDHNLALGSDAAIPGGYFNLASGTLSFAAGRQAKAIHPGAFVWADSTAVDFFSITNNEFAVRAGGGVRFVTTGPGLTLNSQPILTSSSTNAITFNNAANNFSGTFSGDGAGLNNLNAWRLNGNASTTAGPNFLGTTDNQPLEVKVNGARALRLEPAGSNSVNVIGGYAGNLVAAGKVGATIGGGGAGNYFGLSLSNQIAGDFGTVGGGARNVARSLATTIAGGFDNRIEDIGAYSFIGGGNLNVIGTNAQYATISGGAANSIQRLASDGTIGGGSANTIGDSSFDATIGGGYLNTITANALETTIAGGMSNTVAAYGGTIGGGQNNTIAFGGNLGAIPGGYSNTVAGLFGFAAGRRAKANHSGAFVWADAQNADFSSGNVNQFLVRASGGVGINTNSPSAALHIGGTPGTDGIRYPDGTLQTTAPIPVFASGLGNSPVATNQFVSIFVTVTVSSSNQKILVTSNKAFGSTSVGGAQDLGLWIGYRPAGSTAGPSAVGGGVLGNRVAQNTRVIMGLSAMVSGLAPGNYEVGLVGTTTDAVNWNNNEWSYTTATVY